MAYAMDPPLPLVRLRWSTSHMWAWNKLQLRVWALASFYVGLLMAAGAYYLITQVDPDMNAAWHWAVSNESLRHSFRDVGEGFYGGLMARLVTWDHYAKRKATLNWFDRLEMRLHIANLKDKKKLSKGQFAASFVLSPTYAVPGFFVMMGVVSIVLRNLDSVQWLGGVLRHTVETSVPSARSVWAKIESSVTDNWDQRLMGYGAALMWGRRPALAVFDDLQQAVAEQLVKYGRSVHWLFPPTFRARYNDVLRQGVAADQRHGVLRIVGYWLLLLLAVGLAGFGAYVLLVVAP